MSEDERAEELWRAVVVDFADDRTHAALLEHCAKCRRLDEAARRYRVHAATLEGPAREHADRQLAAIAALATTELASARTEPARRGANPVLVLVAGLFLLAALYALARGLGL